MNNHFLNPKHYNGLCITTFKLILVEAEVRCNITVVSQTSGPIVLTSAYHYNTSLTPVITDVYPRRGGTGGGTLVTITGNNFGYE